MRSNPLVLFLILVPALIFRIDFLFSQTLDIKKYNVEHGLAQSQVQGIVQDQEGYLWFATADGLSRFDGQNFTNYTVRDGLNGNEISTLFIDRAGDIWLGHGNGRVTRYLSREKRFDPTPFGSDTALQVSSRISKFLQDREGNLWIATLGSGLFRYDGKTLTHFTDKDGLLNNQVNGLCQLPDGSLWFGTPRGVSIFRPSDTLTTSRWDSLTIKDGLPDDRIMDVLIDRNGFVWIGTRGKGVVRYIPAGSGGSKSKFQHFTFKDGLKDSLIMVLYEDWQGHIWAGTFQGGVSEYVAAEKKESKGYFRTITTENGLSRNFVLSVFQDTEGNYWFGTNGGGVCRYRNNSYQIYGVKDGLIDDVVWCIYEDRYGNFWFGSENGLTRITFRSSGNGKRQVKHFTRWGRIPIWFVFKIVEDSKGNLWFPSYGKGLFKIDPEKSVFTCYTTRDGLPSLNIISMEVDDKGWLWLGTIDDGVIRFDPVTETVKHFTTRNGLSSNVIQVVLRDHSGNIWFGTDKRGIIRYDGSQFRIFNDSTGYRIPSAMAMAQDSKGNFWLITSQGELFKFDGEQAYNYSDLEVLQKESLYSLTVDDQDNIWLGTLRGIARFSPADSSYLRFGASMDFPIVETNQGAIFRDRLGNLWFGTISGAIKYNPSRLSFNNTPPPVYITRLRVFLKDYPLPENGEFSYNKNYLTFHFQGICFTAPGMLKYQYKLEGFDQDWLPPTREAFATYSNLPPGDYIFKVKACNNDGVWSLRPATYSFRILSPFYLTWWFFTLLFGLVVFSVYAGYKYRVRKIEKAKTLLEVKVADRTKQLVKEKEKVEQAYEALMESEEKFRALTETATSAIFIFQGTSFQYVNRAVETVTGYKREELLKLDFWEIVHPDFREFLQKKLEAWKNGKRLHGSYDFKIITKCGKERWLGFTSRTIQYKGKPALLGTAFDITDRIRMEENLRKLSKAVETSPLAIVLTDLKGKIEYVNPGFLAACKVENSKDIVGKPFFDFTDVKGTNWLKRKVIPQLLKGKDWRGEILICRTDQTVFPAELICSVVTDEDGEPVQFLIQFQNIEERKRNETFLKESEVSYRGLFNSIPDAVYVQDKEGRFLDVNKGALKMYGYAKHELIGNTPAMLALPEKVDMEATMQYLRKAFKGIPQKFEWWGVRKNGEAFPKEVVLTRSRYFGQEVVLAIARDITDRKKAEEALRESEIKHRTVIETLPVGIVTLDQNGTITSVNKAFSEIMGFSAGEMVGKVNILTLPVFAQEEIVTRFRRLLKENEFFDFETPPINTPTGRSVYLRCRGITIRDLQHKNFSYLIVIEDITERKQAKQALEEEKERLSVTLRSMGEGVISVDTTGRIVLMNKVAEQLTGWPQEQVIGELLSTVFHLAEEKNPQRTVNPVEDVLKSGDIVQLTDRVQLISRDDTRRAVSVGVAPIRDKSNHIMGAVLIFQDITEKRKMQQEILKAQKIESVGLLAGGIAHDFNNILTGILGNISLAKMYADSGSKVYDRLSEAEKATLRAKNLTQQLLTFSKGGAPVKETASIAEIIRDSVDFTLSGSSVQCEFSLPPDLWTVEVDTGQMSQVLQNLIINAQHAMPEGGTIRVSAENVHLSKRSGLPLPRGHYVKIAVQDEGIGISPEHLDKIFDPYFTTKQQGNGLGLATAYSIIKRHEGHIYAESELGKGSTFYIYLPANPKKTQRSKKSEEVFQKGKGRVLLMDDDELVQEVASQVLVELGYEVVTASDGEEAIKLYREAFGNGKPFDAVIMDLTIPGGMGGKAAIQELRQIDKNVKAVVSSGYSSDPVMANYSEYGFKGCIKKPFTISELSRVLGQLNNS